MWLLHHCAVNFFPLAHSLLSRGRNQKLTSMFPPTLANSGGRGLSRSFLSPLRFGLRALAMSKEARLVSLSEGLKVSANSTEAMRTKSWTVNFAWCMIVCALIILNFPLTAHWLTLILLKLALSPHFTINVSWSATLSENLLLKAIWQYTSFNKTPVTVRKIQLVYKCTPYSTF